MTRWQIRWDASGRTLVIWVADTDGSNDGELGVFAIDDTTGSVNTDEPLLKAPADSSFQVTADRVIYTAQGDDGKTKTFFVLLPQVALPTNSATPAPSGTVDDTTKGGGH